MNNLDRLCQYCLSLPHSQAEMPFGERYLTYKVEGRIFVIIDLYGGGEHLSVKCDPDRAVQLRERYCAVRPGFHLNKRHWNTLSTVEDLSFDAILKEVLHSYQMVVRQLPLYIRQQIKTIPDNEYPHHKS